MKNIYEVLRPDYNNCIVNLACSILKEFGAPARHNGLPLMDRVLSHGPFKNVVVILLDGLGVSIMENALEPDGFLRSHFIDGYSSVFPPTTVASTTSLQSGLYPCEHAWLGWDVYFQELGKSVTVFRNVDTETNKKSADYHVGQTFRPFKSVARLVSESPADCEGYCSTPFNDPYPKSFKGVLRRAKKLCREDGRKFIYCYCEEPDHTLHRMGTGSEESKKIIRKLEKRLELFCSEVTDTLVVVTADHGHMNTENVCIEDFEDLTGYLDKVISLEPRAVSFFIKSGMYLEFEKAFNSHFSTNFKLYTREQIISDGLFGPSDSDPHPAFHDSLGDYIAVATGNVSIFGDYESSKELISNHAGLTKDEMLIPFISVECR